jgi:hypothetical protein
VKKTAAAAATTISVRVINMKMEASCWQLAHDGVDHILQLLT